MQDKQPRDRNGKIIGIGDILVARAVKTLDVGFVLLEKTDKTWRYRVIAVDHLQGSGAVTVECLEPVEPGFERRSISRHDLLRLYEIEP